ncbi:MAG: cadherin-like domain-containing protein, partial [Planctomycetales bacterium]|nr:cadherin-like domain-containing protein [Planctomycetales bacterium]
SYMVQAGFTLTVAASGVLGNDSDPNGHPLTATLMQTTSHGSLTLNSNGGFVYTPTFGFVGSDAFWYVADNGADPSNVATVTITVFNQNPTAANDSFGGYKNQTISGSVLTNDSMADGAQYVTASGPAHGTLTLQANGNFQYVPATGWYGVDTFRYVATQSWTGFQSNEATVTINIINFGPLTLDAAPASNPVSQLLDLQSVNAIYEEAIRRWQAAGVPNRVIEDQLFNVQFILTDLQGSTLSGATDDNRIVIDTNGAGYGWFIDPTPGLDSEFVPTLVDSELQADGQSPAAGHPDLLTALEHEVGHLLGLEHSTREEGHSIMNPTVGLGTRRVPTARDVAILELIDGWDSQRRRS